MNKYFFFIAMILVPTIYSYASELDLVANNKEASSRILKNSNERAIERWLNQSQARQEIFGRSKFVLAKSLKTFLDQDELCDLGFSRLIQKNAIGSGLIKEEKHFEAFIFYLRKTNLIDDILLKNIILSSRLDEKFQTIKNKKAPIFPPFNRDNERTSEIDLETLYADLKTTPDEVTSCSTRKLSQIASVLTWKNTRKRDKLISQLNYLALEKNIISLEVYHRLEVMLDEKVLNWPTDLNRYFDIISNAKDKLSPTGAPQVDPSSYSNTYVIRRDKLTQRGRLYKEFDSTQVMMLADIISKTAKRMDAHNVSINFQFENSPKSEIETYVLSPMERYRLSIKMLRKDMAEVMRSDLFKNTNIGYEDLVSAAYETGLIKAEELELILKFEDFWNPKDPKWKIYASFTFTILGTASFYLPPPWNVVGAIALAVTQIQLNKNQKQADPDDNWNVVI
jgi:hypothetical protein